MKRKNLLISVFIIIIFVFSIVCGYYVAQCIRLNKIVGLKEENTEDEISENEIRRLEAAKIVNSKEEKIGPNTRVVLITSYSVCNHTVEEELEKDFLINLTESELQKKYPDYKINSFSEDNVELEYEEKKMCEEHFLVTEEDGWIVVYKRKLNEENEIIEKEKYITTDIWAEYLPEEDLNNLRNGENIYGWEALNKFLEDYE